jgi:sporulation protein YlmC with PRC-barrel domain
MILAPLPVNKEVFIMISKSQTEFGACWKKLLRTAGALVVLTGLSVIATDISVQAAGNKVGVTKDQMKTISRGWSVKDKIMGKSVYNENKEKIGTIDDLIVTSDKSLSYAIIGVGGFLGMGKHDVAIPMSQLKADQDGFVLPGATKDTLKALPEYAKS